MSADRVNAHLQVRKVFAGRRDCSPPGSHQAVQRHRTMHDRGIGPVEPVTGRLSLGTGLDAGNGSGIEGFRKVVTCDGQA